MYYRFDLKMNFIENQIFTLTASQLNVAIDTIAICLRKKGMKKQISVLSVHTYMTDS